MMVEVVGWRATATFGPGKYFGVVDNDYPTVSHYVGVYRCLTPLEDGKMFIECLMIDGNAKDAGIGSPGEILQAMVDEYNFLFEVRVEDPPEYSIAEDDLEKACLNLKGLSRG